MKVISLVPLIILLAVNSVMAADKPFVVTSASMIYDITWNIGGDHIDLDMIVPIGGDPHIHEPTPSDAQKVNKADLILVNGLTFEGWMNELIENSGTKGEKIIVTEGIQPLTSLQYKNSADPHAWMVASNGVIYARNIRDALIELIPEKADIFKNNFEAYRTQLEELDRYISDQISTIPTQKRILITSHDAFQYYGRRYGLRLEAIMGISTDAEAQTSDIIRVTKAIRESQVPAVFIESTINPKMIKQIATDNNVRIGGQLFADSLGDEDSPADTYINMLKSNTDTIVKALSSEKDDLVEPDSSNSSILFYIGIGFFMILAMYFGIRKLNG